MAILSLDQVEQKKFRTKKFAEGYDMDEVDDFLEEIEETIKHLSTANPIPQDALIGEELNNLRQQVDSLSKENAKLVEQVFNSQNTPNPNDTATIKKLELKNIDDSKLIQDLKNQNRALEITIEGLKGQLGELTQSSVPIDTQNQILSQVESYKQKIQEFQQANAELVENNNELTKKYEKLIEDQNNIQNNNIETQEIIAKYKFDLDKIQKELNLKVSEVQDLKNKQENFEEREKESNNLKFEYEKIAVQLKDIKKHATALNDENINLKNKLGELEDITKNPQYQELANKYNEILAFAKKKEEEIAGLIDKKTQELDEINNLKTSEIQAIKEQAKLEVENAKKELEEYKTKSDNRLVQIEQKIKDDKDKQIEELRNELEKVKHEWDGIPINESNPEESSLALLSIAKKNYKDIIDKAKSFTAKLTSETEQKCNDAIAKTRLEAQGIIDKANNNKKEIELELDAIRKSKMEDIEDLKLKEKAILEQMRRVQDNMSNIFKVE